MTDSTDRPLIVDAIMAVRNERDNIPAIASEIRSLRLPSGVRLRMLFVEDNSTDDTVQQLRLQASGNNDVRYYSIYNPHGQTAAIAFGLSRSDAHATIMMDADGGHPPSMIPEMVDRFLDGADVVQAVRISTEGRALHRNLATRLFQHAIRILTRFDAERQNVFFRLVRREVAARILNENRTIYFLRLSFLHMVKTEYVEFHSPKRVLGRSKYTLKRLLKFSLDGFLSLMSLPRLLLVEALGLGPSALLALFGFPIAAVVAAIPAILVGYRYARLCRTNPLKDIKVIEQA